MATRTTKPVARPAKDEWGVYDPQQAGLAALFARLDAKDAPAVTPASKIEISAATTRPSLRDVK